MNRRQFLAASAGVAASLAGCATSPSTAAIGIIDTHTHFYDPTRPQGVPWPPKGDAVLYHPILPDEFARLTKPLGVGVVATAVKRMPVSAVATGGTLHAAYSEAVRAMTTLNDRASAVEIGRAHV